MLRNLHYIHIIAGVILLIALGCAPLSIQGAPLIDTTRVYPIGEVVVTGSQQATGRNLLPYTVSTINRAQIEASGTNQLLSTLSTRVPGLFISERNIFGFGVSTGGAGSIKIRGVGGDGSTGVLMLVDGEPQFSGLYSHPIADFYETEYVERVEVLRGPASVLYGSNAMGGVINVITRNAQEQGVHTTLSTQYGSFNTWLSSVTNTTRFGKFSSLVSLGYDRTDGVQKDFDFWQLSGFAKVGYDFNEHWQARADYSLMRFVGDDPVYPRLDNPASTDIYHQDISRGNASLSVNNYYESTHGNLRLYYNHGNHFVDDPRHFHSLDNRLGVMIYQNFTPWSHASATAGFDFDIYSGEIPVSGGNAHTPGSKATIERKRATEYSPYLTLSQEFFRGIFILNAGVRMANSDLFGTQWIPQGGFVIHPGREWLVKASVAKGYRNPSFKELYLYRMANPELRPESMMNYEITVGKSFSHHLTLDLTGYYSRGSNLIQQVDQKNVNTGSFINQGIELSVSARPHQSLTLQGSYSYLHTSLHNLTAAPNHQYFLGVEWQPLSSLQVNAELRGVAGLFVSPQIERQDYALLNLKVSYRVVKPLELFLCLNNITDTRYTILRGYTMPGFHAMGGVKVRF